MSHKILIVDDHEPMRRRIRSLLEQENLNVCGEATNGREAIQKAKQLLPDLAILNISMPVLNGLEALPEILQAAPSIKIVIFTIDDAEEIRRHAFRLGAHGYAVKSGPPEDLLAEVKRLLA